MSRIFILLSLWIYSGIIAAEESYDFSWQKIDGAQKYFVEIYSDKEGKKLIKKFESLSNKSKIEDPPLGRIYFRLKYKNSWGELSNFSSLREILVRPKEPFGLKINAKKIFLNDKVKSFIISFEKNPYVDFFVYKVFDAHDKDLELVKVRSKKKTLEVDLELINYRKKFYLQAFAMIKNPDGKLVTMQKSGKFLVELKDKVYRLISDRIYNFQTELFFQSEKIETTEKATNSTLSFFSESAFEFRSIFLLKRYRQHYFGLRVGAKYRSYKLDAQEVKVQDKKFLPSFYLHDELQLNRNLFISLSIGLEKQMFAPRVLTSDPNLGLDDIYVFSLFGGVEKTVYESKQFKVQLGFELSLQLPKSASYYKSKLNYSVLPRVSLAHSFESFRLNYFTSYKSAKIDTNLSEANQNELSFGLNIEILNYE